MPRIRFSHSYPKMWGQKKATLVFVRLLDAKAVQKNDELLEYDTRWQSPDDCGYYPLPIDGKLIQLIFVGDKDIPFCTMRRYTTEKFQYYKNLIHREFDICIGEL